MNNKEITLIVFNTINIRGICIKLGIYQNISDIEQMIYEIILKYDNGKLNNIYNNGALLSFVYICVRNITLSNSKNEWKSLRPLGDDIEQYDILNEDNDKNDMLDWLDKYFIDILNKENKNDDIDKLILYFKYRKGWTLTDASKKLQLSRNMINNYIQQAKTQIKKDFNNK